MREIANALHLLESTPGVNVYLLDAGEGFYLVDSGPHGKEEELQSELEEAGYPPARLKGILLTHGHGDHCGNAAALAERSGAPILGHEADRPFLQKSPDLPAASAAQRFLFRFADRFFFRQPPLDLDGTLSEGDTIEASPPWQVIHTPGHTPGSISFYRHEEGILLCGDALFARIPGLGAKGLRLPLPLVSHDSEKALESARKIHSLPLRTLCFGHGPPLKGDIQQKLAAVLEVEGKETR